MELDSRARAALNAFSKLDTTISDATKNKATYIAQAPKLPAAIETAQPSLQAFSATLTNTGIDLFLRELQLRNQDLFSRINTVAINPNSANFNALITPIYTFKNSLFEYSWTPNAEIENAISAAFSASVDAAKAVNKARKNLNETTANEAQSAATALYNANQQIETAILANRVNVSGNEIDFLAARVAAAVSEYAGLETLLSALESARTLVNSLSTASSSLNTARATTLSTLDSALSAARAGNDQGQIRTSSEASATQLSSLASALTNNGDNVTFETLKSVAAALEAAKSSISTKVTDGRALRIPAKTVVYWSEIAINHAPDLARLARRGIVGGNIAIADNENSAYSTTLKLLNSLADDKDSIALLGDVNADIANAALNNIQSLLATLLDAVENLGASLPTSMAQGTVPTVWYSPACSFLRPNSSEGTWWTSNRWKTLMFYQISSSTNTVPGTLKVNGSGSYRVVTLAAGRALAGQNRATPTSASFLEGINAHLTRDGDATAPALDFTATTPSATFNDRLAY